MADISGISVVLPSLDPDEKLTAVIDGLLAQGFSDIILIDDGSSQECQPYFQAAAAHPQVHLLVHPVNLGKGAALRDGFRFFLEHRPEGAGVITVDGDDQHRPEDARACCEHMLEAGRCVLGCRDFSQPQVPARSRFGNRVTSLVFRIFCGMTISDTQTGLRALTRPALEILCQVPGDRYEYETNMLLAFRVHGIAFDEVKIRTVYLDGNQRSHFRTVRDSWRIYRLILAHFFRYSASSLLCAGVDTLAYTGLNALLHPWLTGGILTAACTVGARAISSVLNFSLNRRLVFHDSGSIGAALARYYALAVPIMAAQVLLAEGIYRLAHIADSATALRTLIYVLVMAALYLVNYMAQQRWVFARKRPE